MISIDPDKAPDKIQHPFMVKTQEFRNTGEQPQLDKEHLLKQTTADSILHGKRLHAFQSRFDA